MDWKKAFKITGAIILILAFVFAAIWTAFNWKTIFSGSKIYTSQQREDYGNQRYNDALEQAEKWRVQVQELQAKVVVYEENQDNLKSQVNTLKSEKETLQNEKTTLQEEVKQKTAKITELEQSHSSDQDEIKTLKEEKSNLEAQILQKNTQIAEKEQKILQLQGQITELQNSVTRLNAELEAYKDKDLGLNKVEFMNGDSVEKVIYYKQGETLPYIPTVEQTKDEWFYGWTKNQGSEEVFNLTTSYTPSGDETFYAVKGPTVPVYLGYSYYDEKSTAKKSFSWYGENLRIRDILIFDEDIDLEDPNFTLELTSYSKKTPHITLDTKLKDFNDCHLYNDGSFEDGYSAGMHACKFDFKLTYKFKSSLSGIFTLADQNKPYFTGEDLDHLRDLGFNYTFSRLLGFDYQIKEPNQDHYSELATYSGEFKFISNEGKQENALISVYECTLDNSEKLQFMLYLNFNGIINYKLNYVDNLSEGRIIQYKNVEYELNVKDCKCKPCYRSGSNDYFDYLKETYAYSFTDNGELWVNKSLDNNSFDYIIERKGPLFVDSKKVNISVDNPTDLSLDIFALEKEENVQNCYFAIIYTVRSAGKDYSSILLVYYENSEFKTKTLIEESPCSITRQGTIITINSDNETKNYTLNEDTFSLDAV